MDRACVWVDVCWWNYNRVDCFICRRNYSFSLLDRTIHGLDEKVTLDSDRSNNRRNFLESSSPGLIAVTSSFVFLAAGTWFALTRRPIDSPCFRS